MSREAVVDFMQHVIANRELATRLGQGGAGIAFVEEAARSGYEFTLGELLSVTNAMRFLHAASEDPGLQGRLRGADAADTVALGAAHGWLFEIADLDAIAERTARELSDDELEHVAGGFSWPSVQRTPFGIPIPYPRW